MATYSFWVAICALEQSSGTIDDEAFSPERFSHKQDLSALLRLIEESDLSSGSDQILRTLSEELTALYLGGVANDARETEISSLVNNALRTANGFYCWCNGVKPKPKLPTSWKLGNIPYGLYCDNSLDYCHEPPPGLFN